MFQSNTNSDQVCDDEGNSLGAGLLITTTTDGKYGRLWRRTTLCVGILIFIKKVPNNQHIVVDIPSESENEEKKEEEQIAQIVKQKDLKSLREYGGVDEVQRRLSSRSEAEAGIDGGQVWVASSADEKSFFYFFWKACSSFPIIILFVSAVLFFVLDIMQQGRKDGWHDGVAILAFVIWLVAYYSVGNFCCQRKMVKKLSENMNKLEVTVERSGQRQSVSISGVKLGDIVHLEKGDRVPADGLLVDGEDLELDEVFNSKIDRDRNPFLFSGSKVVEGRGRMLVTAVGANTAMGKSLSLVTHKPNEKSLLEARIEKPNAYIEKLTLCVSVLVVLVLIIRFIGWKHSNNNDLTELKGSVPMDKLMKMFEEVSSRSQGRIWILTSSLTVMVIAIQNGMPFVITVSLFYWKERVEEYEAKPQNLSACATMGLATVICFDATGGLMCEAVEINNFYIGEKDINNDAHSETDRVVLEALWQGIFGASVLAPEIYARPTNDWLISWAKDRCGFNMEDLHQNYDILMSTKLSCVKKGAGVLMKKKDDGDQFLHWNGAASTILDMCSHYYDSSGNIHAMESQKRKLFEQVIKGMEEKGLRTIAFAYRQTNDVQDLREDGLNLLAVAGLKYSCQEEFKQLVEALKRAGVSIKLVSEDELSAVIAIAHELEIFKPGSNNVALKGSAEIQERMEEMNLATVIGSLLPEDKLQIVKCLKEKGPNVVAYFGGLTTSDTPALKEADVGITYKTRSTEFARENCDIIVEYFASLVQVLEFGRCGYHNIQKFTQLQLTACISGLLITLVTTMITGESPITGIELIWVNLVMCLLGGLKMVMELKSQELLTKQPGNRTWSLITKVMWRNIAIQVLYQASILLIFQFKGQTLPSMNDDVRKTMIFNTFFLCQIFNQFNVMDLLKIQVLKVVLQSYWFLVALVAVMIMQVMVIEFFVSIANHVRLNAVQWALCLLVAALSWGFDWALKFLPLFLTTWSVGTHYGYSHRMTGPYVNISSFGIPFFMFLFFSVSYYLNTGVPQTFR